MKHEIIRTERLVVRPFTSQDIDALYAIYSDPVVMKFVPVYPFTAREQAQAFLRDPVFKEYENGRGMWYAVCRTEDNIPFGYIAADLTEPYDIGWGMRSSFWHHGYMTEAVHAVLDEIRRQQAVPYLTATHDVNNPASGRLMQRLGFRYEYTYAEQWQPKNYPVIFRMYELNLTAPQDFVYQGYWEKFPMHLKEHMEE